jgi:enoyl-CoA hydratase/carnithine racemase
MLITAVKAVEIGLINHAVPAAELDAFAKKLVAIPATRQTVVMDASLASKPVTTPRLSMPSLRSGNPSSKDHRPFGAREQRLRGKTVER